MIALYIILGVIALFFAIIIGRTLAFKPKKAAEPDMEEIYVDKERAVKNLQTLVKFKTVSYS